MPACDDIDCGLRDLRHLHWDESATTSGTGGTFLKARERAGAAAFYYKLSCYDELHGIYGHECIDEIVAARLASLLAIRHLPYRLVHARILVDGTEHVTWLCESRSFRAEGESKVSLERFYAANHLPGEGRIELMRRFGWETEMQQMFLFDYLIANRDRHGANIEVLRARDGSLRLAPLFDNGLSLYFSTYDDATLASIDPLQDVIAHNYLGSRSPETNLRELVGPNLAVCELAAAHRDVLLAGLDAVLSPVHLDAIWAMVEGRWRTYARLRDSGQLAA